MSGPTKQQFLAAAMEYASYGWRVVPLMERDKRPRVNNWQHAASCDEDQIAEWWDRWPSANLGVQLGPRSGLIDVECDSAEAEAALVDLFGGEFPATLTYRASRGSHRLFKWRVDLPYPDRAVFKFSGIEFRTGNGDKGAQSVFPPSVHPSGASYEWITGPRENELAELPNLVVARLWNGETQPLTPGRKGRTIEQWKQIAAGVGEGERNEVAAAMCGKVLGSMTSWSAPVIELCWQLIVTWNTGNSPPLPENELRRTFDSIAARERQKLAARQHEPAVRAAQPASRAGETTQALAEGWRCVIVQSDPKIYRLWSPLWEGTVEVDSDAILKPFLIRRAVLEQREKYLEQTFDGIWNGYRDKESKQFIPGVVGPLIDGAEREKAAIEERKLHYLLSRVWEILNRAQPLRDGESPRADGRACRTQEGWVVFGFHWLLGELNFSGGEKVLRPDLIRALKLVLCESRKHKGLRRQVLTTENLKRFDEIFGDSDGARGAQEVLNSRPSQGIGA